MNPRRVKSYLRQLCADMDAGRPLRPFLVPAALALGVTAGAGCGDPVVQLPTEIAEVCDDSRDNDGDDLIDCADDDCSEHESCSTPVAVYGVRMPDASSPPDLAPELAPEPTPVPEYAAPLSPAPDDGASEPTPEPEPLPEYAAPLPRTSGDAVAAEPPSAPE